MGVKSARKRSKETSYNKPMKTFALFCLLALPALAADTTIVGKVVGVHDGDTLTLRTINETLRVRLSGIDTPELGQPFGNNAKQALSSMVFGKSVTISSTGKDRYGRSLGIVFLGNGNVSKIIRKGMAWHYKQYSDSVPMQQFENTLEQTGLLWSDQPNSTVGLAEGKR